MVGTRHLIPQEHYCPPQVAIAIATSRFAVLNRSHLDHGIRDATAMSTYLRCGERRAPGSLGKNKHRTEKRR